MRRRIRLTTDEERYLESLIRSINRKAKEIEHESKSYQRQSYRKYRKNDLRPPSYTKSGLLKQMKSKRDFNETILRLEKQRTRMFEERYHRELDKTGLSKTLQSRIGGSVRAERKRLSSLSGFKGGSTVPPYVNYKNKVYRDNINKVIRSTFKGEWSKELSSLLNKMTEQQFMKMVDTMGVEIIAYIGSPPNNAPLSLNPVEQNYVWLKNLMERSLGAV